MCDNIETEYAWINNIKIHIKNYIKSERETLLCENGHKLVPVINCKKIKPHFRHKNNIYNNNKMSNWHREWQENFAITEYEFKKIGDQYKDRRADVYIEQYDKVIEFQHSKISDNEVNERKHDYEKHGIDILWIVDGNQKNIEITELSDKRVFIKFKDDWLYKSFMPYDIVYMDINNKIYKLYPKYVKNNMIDIINPYSKDEFIQLINENNNKLNEIHIPNQCSLHIIQKGAGNGKTYGIIQFIVSDDAVHCTQR